LRQECFGITIYQPKLEMMGTPPKYQYKAINKRDIIMNLTFKPLTVSQWDDFVALFGERGACGGCWCMLWRLTRKQFEAQKGELNKQAMQTIVDSGEIPGILAFDGAKAVGWCAIAPRSTYSALSRSRILQPVDDRPCWSVACLFIEKAYRKKGVSSKLLLAATDYAKAEGAIVVEGYPVEPKSDKNIPPAFAWTGISKAFIRAGFKEVARRSPTRPIMRIELS
jgi:GNAT superfamily N-acetyltransferase